MVIQATGTGKSLVYQYLSLALDGVVLVVTPLISLMNDQILKMPKCVSAACFNSYHTREQRDEVLFALNNRKLNVLLMSPERLFLETMDYTKISLICIDEAHCVSEWSHNFRPSYLRLESLLKEKMPEIPRLALTATATLKTVTSVCRALGIKKENVVRTTNISRTNITATVTRDTEKTRALIDLLKSDRFKSIKSIIVYCTYKRTTEQIKRYLTENGISALAYHAGLTDIQRQTVHKSFEDNETRVLVATIAFGMGIDKQDIQGIIHYDMPKSIENYLQEIGRAGRNGEPAFCHMFLNDKDLFEIRKLIFMDHVDYEGIFQIINRVMATAYTKYCSMLENAEKHYMPRKRNRQELENTKFELMDNEIDIFSEFQKGMYVSFPVKPLCDLLDIKEQVIVTMFAKGEEYGKHNKCELYRFLGILPEVCNLRFYKYFLKRV